MIIVVKGEVMIRTDDDSEDKSTHDKVALKDKEDIKVVLKPQEKKLIALKDFFSMLQSIATIVAFVVMGFWTYAIFIKERQSYPHAVIEHEVKKINISDDIMLLKVKVKITNTGNSLLSLTFANIRIQNILPIKDESVLEEISVLFNEKTPHAILTNWPILKEKDISWENGKKEIEPQEHDYCFFEFFISSEEETILIYTFFNNDTKDNLGWEYESFFNLK